MVLPEGLPYPPDGTFIAYYRCFRPEQAYEEYERCMYVWAVPRHRTL